MPLFTPDQIAAFQDVANALQVPVIWLYKLVNAESAFNPQAKNEYSTARGLIQFTNGTARDLGYQDSSEIVRKYPDIASQMRTPVYQYLQKYFPFANEKEFYLSVFLPAYRKAPEDTILPDKYRAGNIGIASVGDYVRFVNRQWMKLTGENPQQFFFIIAAGIAAAALLYTISKKGARNASA